MGDLFYRGLQQSKSYSTEISSHTPCARTLAENEAEAKPWDTAMAINKAWREKQEGKEGERLGINQHLNKH